MIDRGFSIVDRRSSTSRASHTPPQRARQVTVSVISSGVHWFANDHTLQTMGDEYDYEANTSYACASWAPIVGYTGIVSAVVLASKWL